MRGMVAETEAQRPLQHSCCCTAMGADEQQIDNDSTASATIASATTAPSAVSRIHIRLFTMTT